MRRVLRWSGWGLGGLVLLAALLAGGVWMAGNTTAGRSMLEQLIARLTAGHVRLSGLAGSFPSRLTLRRLELRDGGGIWLVADDLAIEWSPLALLRGRVHVDLLQVRRVHMERTPVSAAQGGGAVSLPQIEIGRATLDRVELGAPLTGRPATVSLQGTLRLRSLDDADADLAAQRIDGDGDYALRGHLDAQRIDARVSAHEPASGPLENMLALPGLGALSVTLTVAGPRAAERIDLAVQAGDMTAAARGTVDVRHASADLTYSLQSAAQAPRPDLAWARIALAGKWHGPLAASTADGNLAIDGLRIGSTHIQRLNGGLTAEGGRLALHATAVGLEIPGPEPRLFAADPLTLDAALSMRDAKRPLDLTLTHPLLAAHAHAETVAQTASLEMTLPDVAPFAALAQQEVHGNAVLRAKIAGGRSRSLELDVDLGVTGGAAGWLGVMGPHVTAGLTGGWSDGNITVKDVHVVGQALSVAASGSAVRMPPAARPAAADGAEAVAAYIKSVQTKWQVDITDLKLLSSDLAGRLTLSGQLKGSPTALAGAATLTTQLAVRGSPPGELAAELHASGLPRAPSGTVQAHGMFDGAPLDVDAALDRLGSGVLRILVRRADWKTAHFEGDLTADAAMTQSHGQLQLHIGRLQDFERVLGTSLAGSVAGAVRFTPRQGHTHADLELAGTGLVIGAAAGDIHLRAAGESDAVKLRLTAQLPALNGATANIAGDGVLNLESRRLDLTALTADYRGVSLSLQAPAALSFAHGLAVDDLKLGAAQAVFDLRGELAPALDVQASLDKVSPELLNLFATGMFTSGSVEARARLQGSPSSPTGDVTLAAHDLRFADDAAAGLPAVQLRAHAVLAAGDAALDATLTGGAASKLNLTGHAVLQAGGALDLKVGGKLDLGLVNPMLEAQGLHAAGQIVVDATITGSAGAPVVGGGFTLANGSVRDYAHGVNLSDIDAEAVGNQAGLELKSFKATAVSGSLSMTGTLGLLQPGLPLDLTITAKNAQPVASSIITANLDADLHVSGSLRERIDVAGKVHVNKATINIPNSLPPDVAVLDVRRRGKHVEVAAAKQLIVGIDLVIQAPQEVLVEGRNLDAELGGEIHITGTSADPLVSGGFDLQRGSFTLAGNRLTLTPPGRVGFDGAGLRNKIDPTLDFTAEATLADTTATLHITGLADAPRFDFSSAPPLPQDEIMARLLFGENVQQVSALQAAQIGAALATLSGVGGGSNPLTKLQKTLGLDRLTVGANTTNTATGTENSGAAIAAGRYVSKRVYIEGKQTTTGTSQVQVDVELTKHLKLQTRLGNGTATTQGTTPENDPGSSIGLSYQFEY